MHLILRSYPSSNTRNKQLVSVPYSISRQSILQMMVLLLSEPAKLSATILTLFIFGGIMVLSVLGCRFVSVTGSERKHDRQTCKILPYVLHTAHKVFGQYTANVLILVLGRKHSSPFFSALLQMTVTCVLTGESPKPP